MKVGDRGTGSRAMSNFSGPTLGPVEGGGGDGRQSSGPLSIFDPLPDNVVLRIFSSLQHAKSLLCLRATCRRFQDLASRCDTLVFHASDFDGVDAASVQKLVTCGVLTSSGVRHLSVENPMRAPKLQEVAVLSWCLGSRQWLEELRLTDSPGGGREGEGQGENSSLSSPSSDHWKLEAASGCPRLSSLHITFASFDSIHGPTCGRFKNLEKLSLRHVSIMGEFLRDLLMCCPSLTEVHVAQCYGLGPVDLADVACPRLRDVVIEDDDNEAPLELLRLNAPSLQSLVVVADWIPANRSLPPVPWRTVAVEGGSLKSLLFDMAFPFTLKVSAAAVSTLEKLEVLGDDWPWSIVEDILSMCGNNLEILNLGASVSLPEWLDPALFFEQLPKLKYLNMGPEMFDLLCRSLGSRTVVQAPYLREFHVEYFAHSMDEVHLMAAILRGSPHVRVLQPIYNVLQVRGNGQQSDEEFRLAVAKLREEYPHVAFPS